MLHLRAGPAVVTLAAPGAPLLANGVALGRDGRLPWRTRRVDPRVPEVGIVGPRPLGLADELAAATEVGGSARGRDGLRHLEAALSSRDPLAASRAADRLLGLGPGLTPEGDDLLVAAALALAAIGRAAGIRPAPRRRLAAALCPAGARGRTTRLSATLLALAGVGAGPEALGRLLHGERSGRVDLARLGASSGPALLLGTECALAALSVAARG